MKQEQVKVCNLPVGWSVTAVNFVNRLIKRKPQERLGVLGPEEVKSHPWLEDINWKSLSEKKLRAPFIPSVIQNIAQSSNDNFDQGAINQPWKDDEDAIKQNELLLGQQPVQALFSGYYFDHSISTTNSNGVGKKCKELVFSHANSTSNTTDKAN